MSKARWPLLAVALCLSIASSHSAQLLSLDSTGTRSGNTGVGEFFVSSGDGRFVAFTGSSTNYVANDTNGSPDLFVHDCLLRRNAPMTITDDERFIFFLIYTNFDTSVTDTNNTLDLFRAPLYPPKFLTASLLVADVLPNTSYTLEASTNLLQWSPVQTSTANSQGRITFQDAAASRQRFYRLLWP